MKKSLIAWLTCLAAFPAYADNTLNLDNVVVTASRIPQLHESIVGDVTVINRDEIERMGAGSITDLLQTQPGIQVSSSGGAGTASNVFLRGTNDQHVVVLIDGLRINSATTGAIAIENIPLGQIDRIEILRGAASSLYGADAIGGVVQIFTRKTDTEKLIAHAAIGLGSYDTKTAEAGVSGGVGTLKYGVNVSSLDTKSFSAKRIRTGKDADDDSYRNLSASAFLELELKEGHTWGLQFFESKGHAEFDNNYENFGEQTQQSYAFTSKNQFTDIWHSTFKLGMGVDDSDSYARPNTNPASASYNPQGVSKYRTDQMQITWQNDFRLPIGMLTLAYDRLEQDVNSRSNVKTKFNKERNNDSYLAAYVAQLDQHAIQLSLREDHNTQYGNNTTGGIGYGYHITPEWRVSANYGKAYKAPTFNQLYFPNFGDPSLSPEKSDNVEANVKYTGQKVKAGLTIFENKIRDLIANAGPATTGCTLGGFCPINVGKVEILGATVEGGWNIADNLSLSGNITVQSPRNEDSNQLLVRRGNRYGTLHLEHTWGDLQWGSEVTGASTRYNDTNNTKAMSGYMLVNLTANYKLSPEWKIEARANNILDKNYILAYTGNTATAVPYNTAGSNLFVGLRYDMKH